jgi:hypothetical protein
LLAHLRTHPEQNSQSMPTSDLERQSPALDPETPCSDSVPIASATAPGGGRAPIPRRTRNSAEATEQLFLAAARHAFSAKGYSRTTVQDIVAGTGLSRAAFYQYFRGTHDVFLQIIGAVVDEVLACRGCAAAPAARARACGNRRASRSGELRPDSRSPRLLTSIPRSPGSGHGCVALPARACAIT